MHFKMISLSHLQPSIRISGITLITLISLSWVHSADPNLNSQITPEELNDDSNGDPYPFDFRDDAEEAVRPHYALDPTKTRRLALTEQHLVTALTDIADKMPYAVEGDLCYIYLSKYLSEFKQDTKAVQGQRGVGRANIVAENPLLTLKMIRRILDTLMKDTLGSCLEAYPDVAKTVDETFAAADVAPPTAEDLDDALMGILRIQYIYGLNATKELRLGNLRGEYTGAFLYFDDCLALGKKAIEMEADAIAYQWLTSAPLSPPEILSPQEHLNEDMWDLEQTWLKLLNLTYYGDWEMMHQKLRGKQQDKMKNFFDYPYYATCRGETTLPIESQSTLICFYQFDWDPYFYINPVKTELLSEDPVIFQFYDYISQETIDFVRMSAAKGMTRSGVVHAFKRQSEFLPYRTSMNSWLYDTEEQDPDPKLVTLNKRIEKLTGLEVHKEGASNMQVALYGAVGGHYDFHHDALQHTTAPFQQDGDRIATFLIFLSDVRMGGYTAFPDVGIFAKPIKGSAILWYSLLLNGQEDPRLQHGGCPVMLGSKEVANRWILQYENMWKHPCALDPNE